MPDLTPIPSAQRPADPGYQPVAGYVVAAAAVSGFFAFVVLVLAGYALYSGRTALSYEVLVLPVIGVVLSALGRSQVRQSEGARTGLRLAAGCWWVCVLGGVGFGAYLYANTMAIEYNSAREADKFFKTLRDGQVEAGYEYLLPPEERGRAGESATREDYEKAYGHPFVAYRNSDMIRLFVRNGSGMEVERVGAKDIGQESAGFRATHIYRLRCPEGEFNLQLKLIATESRKGSKPQWYIPGSPAPGAVLTLGRRSEYGQLLADLEREGDREAVQWMDHLSARRYVPAYLMTLPEDRRRPLDAALTGVSALGGAQVPLLPVGPGAIDATGPKGSGKSAADLTFDLLSGDGFFRRDAAGVPIPSERLAKLREGWRSPMVTPAAERLMIPGPVPADATVTVLTPDKVTVIAGADLHYERSTIARSQVGVECVQPEVLAALHAARGRGLDTDAKDEAAVKLTGLPPRGWRVAWQRTEVDVQDPNPRLPAARGK